MKKAVKVVLSLCLLFVLSTTMTLGADLKSYQDKYAEALKGIHSDVSTNLDVLAGQYATSLETFRAKAQRNGQLEDVKAALAEAERFANSKTVTPEDIPRGSPSLENIQASYIREVNSLKRREVERTSTLTEKYDRVLAQLQSELTKEGNIEAASAVLAERKEAKHSSEISESKPTTAGQSPTIEIDRSKASEVQPSPAHISGEVRVKALIDSLDILKVQGNKLWYEHIGGALPGKWAGQNQPTFINKKVWMPVWENTVSKPYEDFKPGMSESAQARVISGRGKVTVLEQPGQENDYTLSVSLADLEGGAAWTEFELRWVGNPIPAKQQVAEDPVCPPPGAGTPCVIYWSCADVADVYVNGRPLRQYKPSFYSRPDEANREFSVETAISKNDVITVGARRGGSFGVVLVVVEKSTGKVICKTDAENWKTYVPANTTKWYLPERASVARKTRPKVQKEPWMTQVGLQGRYDSVRPDSIWAIQDDQYAYFVSTVR